MTQPPKQPKRPGQDHSGARRPDGDAKIRRTLHFKFTLPGANEQMIAMIKSAAPLYQMFGDAKVRLLQNVDDPKPLPAGDRVRRAGGDGAEPPAARQRSARAEPTCRPGAPCFPARSRSTSTRTS